MKVLAIGAITKAPTPEQSAQVMPREVPATLQLYLDEKIDQFWFRHDKQASCSCSTHRPSTKARPSWPGYRWWKAAS